MSSAPSIPLVHSGIDGWLFLSGGSNEAIRYYNEADFFQDSEVESWCDLLQSRYDKCKSLNVRYLHFFAPEKISVYHDKFGHYLPYFHRRPSALVPERLALKAYADFYLDLLPFLSRAKTERDVYLKTDSHWNFNGALAAYYAICEKLGVVPNTSLEGRPFGEPEVFMDLGSRTVPKISERVRFYSILKDARRVYANGLVRRNEETNFKVASGLLNLSHVIFVNDKAPVGLKAILFGDSFSEFRHTLLTAMLAETFAELHFVWSTSVDFSYIEDVMPDIVMSEMAERFVKIVPDDSVDVRLLAEQKLAEHVKRFP